jgi:hypothetical protein
MHFRGVPTAVISKWLGRATASFTMATYVHSQDEALAAAGPCTQQPSWTALTGPNNGADGQPRTPNLLFTRPIRSTSSRAASAFLPLSEAHSEPRAYPLSASCASSVAQ